MMRDVAIWKYLHQIPVEDKAREKIILEDIRRRSEEKGLSERDISVVMAIFEDQIHVARMMQTDWIKKMSNSDLTSPGSLDQQIRPKIHQITGQQLNLIFSQILSPEKSSESSDFDQISERHLSHLSPRYLSLLLQNLRKIF